MPGQLLNPTDTDRDPAECRKISYFYQQFGTTSIPSNVSSVCYTHCRPCHRHNSGSLPSVKNHNYLGRSVPPAVLFKHYGRADTHGWYWENCHDDRAATCFLLLCVLFSKGEARIAPIWLELVCAWLSLQLFKPSQPYIVQMEILSYSCKIIFRNVCKVISCDKLHNLLLDQDSFRCCFSLDNQIVFCFKAVQLLPDAAPCRTSFLIARLGPDVDCIISKNPSAPTRFTSSPVSCQCRVPGISGSFLSLLT